MKKFFSALVLTLSICLGAFAQERDAKEIFRQHEMETFREYVRMSTEYIPDTNIDVKFYYLDLSIAIDSAYISGIVSCEFELLTPGLSEVWFSLNSALQVTDVTGNTTGFSRMGDSLMITLDSGGGPNKAVSIFYEGIPALAGGYKGLRYETHHGSEPVIATLSTPYLAHYWYPCKDGPSDKPDSVYVDISIPVKEVNGIELMAVSNGVLENVIDNTTEKTYQWRHRYPVVPYYVMVAISNYVHFGENYSGIYGEEYPLDYYVFQQDLSASQSGIEDLPLALDIFSEKFGEYPFSNEKYGMTQLGFYGAIENQTNTIQNNLYSGWFDVSVHELGHMWFGDMITCGSWNHAWLNEGFASYSEAIYHEGISGFSAYQSTVSGFQYWDGGTLYLQNAGDTFNIFQGIIYDKGAYVLHMLRGALGDSIFFECLYEYATDPALMYGQAVTSDLQQVCESVSGESLDYFFDQWVYDEYYPVYHYNFEDQGGELDFVIKQVQGQQGRRPVFTMPVEVKLLYENGGDTIVSVWNDSEYQVFSVPVSAAVEMIQIDPNGWILDMASYRPELPVGSGEHAPMPEILNIYPVPARDGFYLDLTGLQSGMQASVEIYNAGGQRVAGKKALSRGLFYQDRGSLPAGTYYYILRDENGQVLQNGKLLLM